MLKKRILGFLLSACILASSLPVYAFADGTDTTGEQSIQEVISGESSQETTNPSDVTSGENQEETTATTDVTEETQETGSTEPTDPTEVTETTDPTESTGGVSYHRYLSSFANSEMPLQKVGWGSYSKDKNLEGGKITLRVNGENKQFLRGVLAHAPAELQYDLGENHHYDYFSGYLGIDVNRSAGSVIYNIYVSNTTSEWTSVYTSPVKRNTTDAEFVKISVSGYRYLRIVISISDNGNSSDHAAIADAKVYSSNYVPNEQEFLKPLSYYNEKLANKTYDEILADPDLELALLQREFVKRVDIDTMNNLLSYFCDENGINIVDKTTEFFNWLFNDLENMRLYIGGGMPESGEYVSSITILNNLYQKYKADLNDTQPLYAPQAQNADDTRGDLYKRMMITLSLTHTVTIRNWVSGTNQNPPSDPILRYQIFKDLYEDNLLENKIFENLEIEEMRWVMKSHINDDEIKWLNYWVRKTSTKGYNTSSYNYVRYAANYNNYNNAEYYSEENREKWDAKYNLSEYGVTYYTDRKHPRLWIVFEEGAVCGGISKTYQNISAAFGVPSNVMHQPAHAACGKYEQNADGSSYWWIFNDVSNWPKSRIEITSDRMLLGWGTCNSRGVSGYQFSYINATQAALDDYDNYLKAEEIVCLADLATTTEEKIACYQKALEYLPYHIDAWYELIQVYLNDSTKTSQDFGDLAEQLADSMKFFPLPMSDLMNLISNKLTAIYEASSLDADASQISRLKMLKQAALTRAKAATYSDLPQYKCTVNMANSLLGNSKYTLATFSFDGTNKNKLMFDQTYQSVTFRYCLNYSDTEQREWSADISVNNEDMSYEFPAEEIAKINADDDIKILLVGLNDVEANYFTIDILAPAELSDIYCNDNENRILGNTTNVEYSIDYVPADEANGVEKVEGTWQPLTNDIEFKGNVKVYVRKMAYGTTLATAEPHTCFTFTNNEETTPKTRSYISITREKIYGYSTQETSRTQGYASYAIDGIPDTRWHSNYSANSDLQRYIIVEFDKPTYFSGINYTPVNDTSVVNGRFTACEVYVSVDAQSWYLAGSATGWASDTNEKQITFTDPAYGQYVKVVATKVAGTGNHAHAATIEFYEDTTIADKVIAGAKIVSRPTKLTYQRYEALDLTGLAVKCFYTDGTSTNVPTVMLNVDTTTFTNTGTQTVGVKYLNLPAMEFEVEVTENARTATAFDIQTNPTKLNYYAGDKLDLTGMVLKATDSTGSWYPSSGYTVSISDIDLSTTNYTDVLLTEGTHTVTVTYQNLSDTFDIVVDKEVDSISVTTPPTNTQYFVGTQFDDSGMVVTLNYKDGTTKTLTDSDYIISNLNSFSALSGTKQIGIYLLGRSDIFTTQEVTVLPNFVYGDFEFELVVEDDTTQDGSTGPTPSADATKTYRVKISNYTNETETNVVVPHTFKIGDYTYMVVGVEADAFVSATQVESLTFYGNDLTFANGSLTTLANLTKIYLTDATSVDNIVFEKGALSPTANGTIYTASTELKTALDEKLSVTIDTEEGVTATPIKEGYTVVSVTEEIQQISIDSSTKTTYNLDEYLDKNSVVVIATLANGTTITLSDNMYSIDKDQLTVLGTNTVTVSLNNSDITTTFDIEVESATMAITEQPQDASYLKVSEQTVEPLRVEVTTSGGTVKYQWYYSTDDTLDPETDEAIQDATSSVHTLESGKNGYYYVIITCEDANGTVCCTLKTLGAYVIMGDFLFIIENRNLGAYTLTEAVDMSQNGDIIKFVADMEISSTVSIGSKIVTIDADNHTIRRAQGFLGSFITIAGGTLTLKNALIDGGAVWEGTINEKLGRSTTNTGITANDSIIKLTGSSRLNIDGNVTIQNASSNSTTSFTGAAIRVADSSVLNATGLSIKDCQTLTNNYFGAIGLPGAGQITLNGGTFSGNYSRHGSVVCTNSNSAKLLTINGGTYSHNQATNGGAVVFIGGGSKASITNSTFENNNAADGAVLYQHAGSTVTFSDNICNNNTANYGGVVFMRSGGNTTFNNNTCNNITANENGGVIYNTSGATNSNNVNAYNCTAKNGGFLWNSSKYTNTIQNSTFDTVTATVSGGCVYNNGASIITLTNLTVNNSSAGQNGGFLYNAGTSTVNINGGTITGSTAVSDGGCIYNASTGTININNDITITNCNAQNNGGAIYLNAGTVNINSGTFTNNTATLGDSVYNNSTLKIANFTEIGEIYLPTDKFITISGDMSNKAIPVNMQTHTPDTKVATCTDATYAESAKNSITITNEYEVLAVSGSDIVITDAPKVDISGATVSNCLAYYDGTQKTLAPVVMYNGEELVADVDYTITGTTTATDAGEYTLTLTGTRGFTGSKTVKCRIVDKVNFAGASLTLQNNIAINYYVDKSYFETGADTSAYVVFNMNDNETTVTDYKVKDGYYLFTFTNIGPHLICDTITAELHINCNGREYSSDIRTYSVKEYCDNVLSRTSTSDTLKTLIVDLLDYASMAQIAVNHNVDNIPNNVLTDEQKAFATKLSAIPEYTSDRVITSNDNVTPTLKWTGASLNLNNSIDINAYFTLADTEGAYVVVEDRDGNIVDTINSFEDVGGGEMRVTFNKLVVTQLRDIYKLTAYNSNGEKISDTLTYSVQSYAYAKQNSSNKNLVNLINSMMKYGYSASVYAAALKQQ